MKCLIVDDEPLAREGMELNVADVPSLELVGQCSNAVAANDFLQKHQVDLMFLDIEMPGITGLDFIRSLRNPPLIILTTAYPQYALESYELDVVDYLVKPVRLERFVKAINRAKEVFQLQQATESTIEAIEQEYVYIKSERRYIRVFFKDIKYIKGLKDYVMLFTDKEKIMTAMNIKTINSQLPDSIFVRVSKSYIININFIDSIDIDFIHLGEDEIPLGRTYRDAFIENYVKTNLIARK